MAELGEERGPEREGNGEGHTVIMAPEELPVTKTLLGSALYFFRA